MKKKHCKKTIVLDNCVLLRELQVKVPEEFLCLENRIKEEFWCIEQFYSKFLKTKDFVKDLTVIFHLKTLMKKNGDFFHCDSRTGKPVINIFDIAEHFRYGSPRAALAHEFAHFIDWNLGKITGFYYENSGRKGTEENELALKYLSFNEVSLTGSLSCPPELFARYLEQYYKYCFRKVEIPVSKRPVKNCLYVRSEDFEKELLQPVSKYLNFFHSPYKEEETILFEGNLYSADKKVLLKYQNSDDSSEFTVPDFVEIIGTYAFADCNKLVSVTIGSGVKEIGSFAFHHCEALTSIYGGENINLISQCAFAGCTALKEIKGFKNLEIVSLMSFSMCKSLVYSESFNRLKYIGDSAFARCESISPENFIDKVSYIEKGAFRFCDRNKSA